MDDLPPGALVLPCPRCRTVLPSLAAASFTALPLSPLTAKAPSLADRAWSSPFRWPARPHHRQAPVSRQSMRISHSVFRQGERGLTHPGLCDRPSGQIVAACRTPPAMGFVALRHGLQGFRHKRAGRLWDRHASRRCIHDRRCDWPPSAHPIPTAREREAPSPTQRRG